MWIQQAKGSRLLEGLRHKNQIELLRKVVDYVILYAA